MKNVMKLFMTEGGMEIVERITTTTEAGMNIVEQSLNRRTHGCVLGAKF